MTDRNEMDRPAAVTAFALGVILILVSASLFAFTGGGGGGKTYGIAWTESSSVAATGQQAAEGSTASVSIQVDDALVSEVVLQVDANDNRGPGNLAPAAACTWTLRRGDETVDSGDTCDVDETYERSPQPDVAEAKGSSPGDAVRGVWDAQGGGNETATYTLEFRWTRADGTGPLPVPPQQTGFTATLSLSAREWTASASERAPEAAR